MADQALDLWPQLDTVNVQTPVSILKQQGMLLGKHTKNLLEGRVFTHPHPSGFLLRFEIYAPTLNYAIELFSLTHDVNLYPVLIRSRFGHADQPLPLLGSEEQFINWLKEVFNSGETKRVLATLLAQVES